MHRLFVALAALGSIGAAEAQEARILFLHHSTGGIVWDGGVPAWFDQYNAAHGTRYRAEQRVFPSDAPYGWANYPYDYWNIWVQHAGNAPYQGEPTLEMLTPQYQVIALKHCYPVSNVEADRGAPDIASDAKRMENYVLQYEALKATMRRFPATRFVLWTGAALAESNTNEGNARRAEAFFDWVVRTWDEPGDNIFLWDFRSLETEGGLYIKPEYAAGAGNSHPNDEFARMVAPLFGQRLVDVIEGRGDSAGLTGRPTAVSDQAWGEVKRDR
jgi:hypothetical protein